MMYNSIKLEEVVGYTDYFWIHNIVYYITSQNYPEKEYVIYHCECFNINNDKSM